MALAGVVPAVVATPAEKGMKNHVARPIESSGVGLGAPRRQYRRGTGLGPEAEGARQTGRARGSGHRPRGLSRPPCRRGERHGRGG